MRDTLVALAAILALLNISQAFIPPAGKCKDITPIKVNYTGLTELHHWHSVYYPDGEEFNNVDSDYEDFFDHANNVVYGVHRIQMKDGSVSPYVYKYSYAAGDDVVYEEVISDKGEKLVFRLYNLDFVPGINAFLYYRCLETGSLDYDTRYICMPRGNSLDTPAEQQLLTKDASYNFSGGIQKLNNRFRW